METTASRRSFRIAAVVLALYVAVVWVRRWFQIQHQPLFFDDAYMFVRYAHNLRHGHGFSWNPDGVPTYGPTSPLWVFAVLLFSFLPLGDWAMLTVASLVCSVGALFVLSGVVAQNARTAFLKSRWNVFLLTAVVLCWQIPFSFNQVTGMETMLAMLLLAGFLGASLRWLSGKAHPAIAAAWGMLAILTRPESAIVVLLFPLCAYALLPEKRAVSFRSLVALLGCVAAGLALEFAGCKLYFGTAFPLSLYMKGHAAYQGYAGIWYPDLLLIAFLAGCLVFLVALVLVARRTDRRLLLCFFIPAAAVFGYLLTITQIMGLYSRFYAPYFPLLILPAFLVADRWAAETGAGHDWPKLISRPRIIAAAVLVCLFFLESSQRVQLQIRLLEHRRHIEYDPVQFTTAATRPLPTSDWFWSTGTITNQLVSQLPAGTTVAATEVGFLAARSPQVNLIDMAGLNDTQIALHGFSVDSLLARKPDVIWLPHKDYTWHRGMLVSDPRLLQQYDVYPNAANYGIALRKDSHFRPQIDQVFARYWAETYPGYAMADYRALSGSWSGQSHTLWSALK